MKILNSIRKSPNQGSKLLILSLVLLVTLSACTSTSQTNSTADTQKQDSSNKATTKLYDVVWWGLFDKAEVIQPIIDKYNTQHPNINISYIQITDGLKSGRLLDNYRMRLDKNLTNGEPLDTPDIITINNTWLGRYSKYLSPAPNNIFSLQDIEAQYYPIVKKDFVRGSSVYAVPLYMDSLALIVNKSLMISQSAADSAGPEHNWFDFSDQVQRFTSYDKQKNVTISGFAGGAANVEFLTGILSTLLMQSNIKMDTINTINGFSAGAVFASDAESQSIIDFYHKFGYDPDKKVWNIAAQSEVSEFLKGKLVIFAAPSWRLNDVLRLNEKYGLNLNVEVYPLPQINPSDKTSEVEWATYWGLGVTADSQKRGQSNEVWSFLKFLSDDVQLKALNNNIQKLSDRKLNIIYPKPSLSDALKSDKYLKVYVNALEKADNWDMVDGFLVDDIVKNAYDTTPNASALQTSINSNVINKRTNLLTSKTAQ